MLMYMHTTCVEYVAELGREFTCYAMLHRCYDPRRLPYGVLLCS